MSEDGGVPIEKLQPGEAVDLCNRFAAAINLAGEGDSLRRGDAWERLARALAKRFDTFNDLMKPSVPSPECFYEARTRDGTREGRAHGGAEAVWCRVHGFDCPNTIGVPGAKP